MSIRRELNKRRQARRAARATEQGVAGHQAAMAAIGRASGKGMEEQTDPNTMWRKPQEVTKTKYVDLDAAGTHPINVDTFTRKAFQDKKLSSAEYRDQMAENAVNRFAKNKGEEGAYSTWTGMRYGKGNPASDVHFEENKEFYKYPGKRKKDK